MGEAFNESQRYGNCLTRIKKLRVKSEEVLLESAAQKVASMFLEVVLVVNACGTIKKLIGIKKLEEFSMASTLEELAELIPGCGLFQYDFGDEFKKISGFITAWNNNYADGTLNLEAFLRECIIARTGMIGHMVGTEEIIVDPIKRQELCVRYGVEA